MMFVENGAARLGAGPGAQVLCFDQLVKQIAKLIEQPI
jgi:hypothetical protein